MDSIISAIKSALKPVQSLYNKAFNANKYAAGIGLSIIALNLGMYLGIPAIVVVGIRKKF